MSTIKLKLLSEKMGICYTTARNMANNNKIPNCYKTGGYNEWYIDDYEIFLKTYNDDIENKLTRICSNCGKIQKFKTIKIATQRKKQKICQSCARKQKFEDPVFYNKVLENNRKLGKSQCGQNNPIHNHPHSKELLEQINKKRSENKEYQQYLKSDEFKATMSSVTKGNHNGMYGRKIFDIWVEKYGIAIANQKQKELNFKRSQRMIGSKNNMFGKPSPQKTGNGTSGHYKNIYFRSLRELYYIITYLEPNNLPIISAEKKELEIPYINYDGTERTYRADFLVGNTLIEIKPLKLKDTPLIKIKQEAAELFCRSKNMIYKIEYIEISDYSKIFELYKQGYITIDEKKRESFEKYIK